MPVYAESFRCNSKVVMVGYSSFEVKDKCGQPQDEEDIGYVMFDGEYASVKRFVYDFSHGKLLKTLEFHNGKPFKISDGSRR